MTAENSGKFAIGRTWSALKVLRDQWMVAAFLATSLFWARDVIWEFAGLPARVNAQEERVGDLTQEVARLNGQGLETDRTLALKFPGTGHSVEDGRPGERVMVTLSPVLHVRADSTRHSGCCVSRDFDDQGFSAIVPPQIQCIATIYACPCDRRQSS